LEGMVGGALIVTSHRSPSLKRVALDIAEVINSSYAGGARVLEYPDVYTPVSCPEENVIIVMTFNPGIALPYFYLAWNLVNHGKRVIFYTTVEGPVKIFSHEEWIVRDLTYTANSLYTFRKLVESGARVDRVIYHGVSVARIRRYRDQHRYVRKYLGFSEEDFIVGYVAGGYRRKGHDLFAKVINIVSERDPTIKFAVITDHNGASYYENVENVVIIPDFGKLPESIIYGFYHAIDLYAQASLSEGFGLPVVEALAAGKPVVHADYDPLSEITTPGTSFRVPVTSIEYVRDIGSILFEHHIYDPKEFADTIIYAKEEVTRDRERFESRCVRRAEKFDVVKTYKPFIDWILSGGSGE